MLQYFEVIVLTMGLTLSFKAKMWSSMLEKNLVWNGGSKIEPVYL